jgi:predicted nucleic acid-binding protein
LLRSKTPPRPADTPKSWTRARRKGRNLAVKEGVPIIGLLGVVLLAKRRGLIPSARALLQGLDRDAGMYLSPEIRDAALESVGE